MITAQQQKQIHDLRAKAYRVSSPDNKMLIDAALSILDQIELGHKSWVRFKTAVDSVADAEKVNRIMGE